MSDLNERLTAIELMLEATLRASDAIMWCNGYTCGRTESKPDGSGNDPFVLLFPAAPYLDHKYVKVYVNDFHKLPDFVTHAHISPDEFPDEADGTTTRSRAQQRGVYHECRPFQVLTYPGKETQMGPERRFMAVVKPLVVPQSRPQSQPEIRPQPAAQPATNGQTQAQPAPDWRAAACGAHNVEVFDHAVHMATGIDANRARSAMVTSTGLPFDIGSGEHRKCMYEALSFYERRRKALINEGSDISAAHAPAWAAAVKEYNKQ